MYCGIIGDILKSKTLDDRSSVLEKLQIVLDNVNKSFEEELASKFIVSDDYELQGFLKKPGQILSIIRYINIEMYPIELRFGIGFGDRMTNTSSNKLYDPTGPADVAAREAIDCIKLAESKYEMPYQRVLLGLVSKRSSKISDSIKLINATLSTTSFIESKWTDKQREVIKLIDNQTQMSIANKLGISKSSVYKRINASGYYTYKYAMAEARELIIKLWDEL